MPRPTKCRKVCHFPQTLEFVPAQVTPGAVPVVMTVDEYEVIRLIDREGLSQEQCSQRMQVARTTAQKIYESARRKLALALVDSLPLQIAGGEIQLCTGDPSTCGDEECYKHRYHRQHQKPKGELMMRIAVTYQNGQIFQHFGHTDQFKIYDVQDGRVIAAQVVDTNGSGHGALAGVLTALKADALICGGIGSGAQMALAAANIRLYGGVSGDADTAVEALLAGQLDFNPSVRCDHHDHSHGEGHTCGDHGCGGEHHCGSDHHCGGHH